MLIWNLGTLPYGECLELMLQKHSEVVAGTAAEGLFVVQHLPVVTLGQRPLFDDLLIQPALLNKLGIAFHRIDRGGSATIHEPGQIVVYPILRMDSVRRSVRNLISCLEESVILTCADFGINAARNPINPGVWVNNSKIAAVGIRVDRRVSRHGMSFNVTNTLSTFQYIVPCGLKSSKITSVLLESGGRQGYSESQILDQALLGLTKHLLFLLDEPAGIPKE